MNTKRETILESHLKISSQNVHIGYNNLIKIYIDTWKSKYLASGN